MHPAEGAAGPGGTGRGGGGGTRPHGDPTAHARGRADAHVPPGGSGVRRPARQGRTHAGEGRHLG